MRNPVLLFRLVTLVLFAGIVVWILLATPVTPMQTVGTIATFTIGWFGLTVAGGSALDKVLERRKVRNTPPFRQ